MEKIISVIGLGYIGLPTAAVLASRKIRVLGIDIDRKAVDLINNGKVHIVEPDLDILVRSVVQGGYLSAHLTVQPADVFIIAVPTPFDKEGSPDTSYIEAAVRSICSVLKADDTIILESTSPIGTTRLIVNLLAELRPDLTPPSEEGIDSDYCVAYCPERVLPGKIIYELFNNDRIIGGITSQCSQNAREVYEIFVQGQLVETSDKIAEMCKLSENAFRDVNIAFANELSLMADKFDVDVWELIKFANLHPRVNILQPGCGVGGHCIAVDPWFLISSAPEHAKIIRKAREVNDEKPNWVLNKVKQAVDDFVGVRAPRIAVFGLTFKPNIDDLRESPALLIGEKLYNLYKNDIVFVEPNLDNPPEILEDARFQEIEDAVKQCDIAIILVAHKQFKGINFIQHSNISLLDFCGLSK